MEKRLSTNSFRILLAEDDEMIRRSLVFSLGREGYSVRSCPDGSNAWEAFLKEPAWDLLVTDLEMPGMNGLELARRIRSRDELLPILILTGHDKEALDSLGELPPCCQVLAKPYRLDDLLRQIALGLSAASEPGSP